MDVITEKCQQILKATRNVDQVNKQLLKSGILVNKEQQIMASTLIHEQTQRIRTTIRSISLPSDTFAKITVTIVQEVDTVENSARQLHSLAGHCDERTIKDLSMIIDRCCKGIREKIKILPGVDPSLKADIDRHYVA